MECFDFDCNVSRRGTDCLKYDFLNEFFGREDLFPLWIADMDFGVAPQISEALRKRVGHNVYGYSAPKDSYWNSIINWLGRRHGFEVSRDELAFVPGVVRGLAYAINFFSRPGDKIVIQPPVYPPFRRVSEGNGRVVVENPLKRVDNGLYEMDFDNLEAVFANERPKMMILCNPHNPAGVQWSADDLRRVAALAKKYGVIVLSDEIHGDLMLEGGRHIPFASVSDEAAEVSVTFGAPSKTFNIPGLVSSWMVVKNPTLRAPFYEWMEVNEFSAPTMFATVATEAAYNLAEEWLDALIPYIEGNIAAVESFFAEKMQGIVPVHPQASFLLWLDCRGLGLDDSALEKRFMDAGLALNAGHTFGGQGSGYMRLNVALPRKTLIEQLERLV